MKLVRNPLVWLWRIRHRRGYGIHSPFAYNLVTQVLYSPGEYYADAWLPRVLPRWQRFRGSRPLACHQLLFRLANYFRPEEIVVPQGRLTQAAYLHAGCPGAHLVEENGREAYTLYIPDVGSVDVVYDLQRYPEEWDYVRRQPDVTVTFDLYDMGIAVANPKLNKQHYVINW